MLNSEKLEVFRAAVEAQQCAELIRRHYDPAIHQHDCRIKIGRKYITVDVGRSGKYMVEIATGQIFEIKSYGVVHRGHTYGTLDTIDQWDWSGYTATRKAAA